MEEVLHRPRSLKLADFDNVKVIDLNMTECRNDGLKSKYDENVHVQKGEWDLHHLVMVGAMLTYFALNFTLRLNNTPGDMKDFSSISDTNKKLLECVFGFSFYWKKRDIVHHDGGTMSVRSMLTDKVAHPHAHGHAP